MDDGYLVYATIHWEQAGVNDLLPLGPANIRLLDANGQEMQFSLIDNENTGTFRDKHQTVIAIKTTPVQLLRPVDICSRFQFLWKHRWMPASFLTPAPPRNPDKPGR